MKTATTESLSTRTTQTESTATDSATPQDQPATVLPPRASGGFRLLRYFSVASLIAIVLAVAGLGFFFRGIAVKQLTKVGEDNNVALARAFANTLRPQYNPLLEAAANLMRTEPIKVGPEVTEVHRAVLDAVRQTNVVKVKIYDLTGRTIYSSKLEEVGADEGANPGFIAARVGGVKTVLFHSDSFESFGQTITNRDLLASHVPVRRSGLGELDAVFELHSDVTPFFEEIRQTQTNIRFGTAAVMILLYGALFFIVKRADNVIKRQAKQREEDEQTIRFLAHHDPLTGLPNRKLFSDRLFVTLARVKRSGRMAALMFLDLDRFKEINDTLGHPVGDQVLVAAGKRLRGLLRDTDTVARLGGDEFTIILEDVGDAAHVETVAEKIREAFTTPVVTGDPVDIVVSPSMGIALYPVDADSGDALLRAADVAMYDAKAAGRNTYRFYRRAPDARAPA